MLNGNKASIQGLLMHVRVRHAWWRPWVRGHGKLILAMLRAFFTHSNQKKATLEELLCWVKQIPLSWASWGKKKLVYESVKKIGFFKAFIGDISFFSLSSKPGSFFVKLANWKMSPLTNAIPWSSKVECPFHCPFQCKCKMRAVSRRSFFDSHCSSSLKANPSLLTNLLSKQRLF